MAFSRNLIAECPRLTKEKLRESEQRGCVYGDYNYNRGYMTNILGDLIERKTMKFWVIYTAVIGLVLLILCLALSGCSALCGHQAEEPVITEPPTPGVQLWQAARKSNWLVTVSILGVATGVFALVNGAVKLGTASIASASVSLFMALAVARFALWMAVFGLIGSVTAALFSILVRHKALVEIIKGVQEYRNNGTNIDALTETLDDNQSSSTKQIVGNIKNGLKILGII